MPSPSGVLLAGVGGYVDTVGFMTLDGLFVNHVTGNLVLAAAAPRTRLIPQIALFALFFLMVLAGAALAKRFTLAVALGAEALCLGLFLALGVTGHAHLVVGAAGVSAMAIQTAVTRLAGHPFPTNMVTGTMTALGMDAAALLFGSADERAATRQHARHYTDIVLAFAGGAGLAAAVTAHVGIWAALLPVVVIAAMAVQSAGVQRPNKTQRRRQRWQKCSDITTSASA